MSNPRSLSLEGKTAIVTGASRGIGLAIARSFHDLGANVVLTSRTAASAEAAAEGVGERAMGFEAHATSQERACACVDETLAKFGSIDILVNNAGTNPAYGPVIDQDYGRFSKTLEVNLWAPVLWTSLVVKSWMGEHGGSIINTSSVGGLAVGPDLGVYHVSKAALIHLTKQLAFELGPKVRVNAVAPGVVRTKLSEALWQEREDEVAQGTPLGRIGEPEDVSAAVSFLASDASSWITGTTTVIDGGQILGKIEEAPPAADRS
ncbi:SDR family oxidoreductase [Aeromicrobium chenweiae]|uniref:3-oxoacyl-ACP reductase n=1 Tax=Aeromicrobium chenweiae TaxID=2079793 RepID=A0A2S0WI94_9ACTN|nr:SDR family oxidoreductase [Aeromicrobium chenweiae]AWB90950.1 3-oxoacyl-ACP reductase [Aeromicrobium chenweiae]TGN32170.1 SDR family oxidoreductase [Aeromicrobium chenweiae]